MVLVIFLMLMGLAGLVFSTGHSFVREREDMIERELNNQFLGPACGPDFCWCNNEDESQCPAYPYESVYTFKTDVVDFYENLKLDSPGCDLQICSPDLSTSINTDNIALKEPGILFDLGILPADTPACSRKCKNSSLSTMKSGKNHPGPHPKSSKRAVCGIRFKSEDGTEITPEDFDDVCNQSSDQATRYEVKTFRDDHHREKEGYFTLHEGVCGACSTAQDLATYMKYSITDPQTDTPNLATLGFLCHLAVSSRDPDISPKDLVDGVSRCLQNGDYGAMIPAADLSKDCAYTWAINVFLTGLQTEEGGCKDICTMMLDLLLAGECHPVYFPNNNCPYDADTCELHSCLQCDDSVSGDAFIQMAGMTRRNAGIHTLLPRKCGSLASHVHTCVAILP